MPSYSTPQEQWENSNNSTCAAESEPVFPSQDCNWDSSLWDCANGMNGVEISSPSDSQAFCNFEISENATGQHLSGDPTLLPPPLPANRLAFKANGKEPPTSEIASQQSWMPSSTSSPNFSASKTSPASSVVPNSRGEFGGRISEICCCAFTRAGTMQNGCVWGLDTLARPSVESGYCWLDSPGALSARGNGRPPGQSKLEAQLRKSGAFAKRSGTEIAPGEVLDPAFLCRCFNLPPTYLDPSESKAAAQLLEDSARQPEIFSIPELLPLPSSEFSISIPSEGQDSNFAPRGPLEGSAQNFSPTKAQAISLWQPWASFVAMGLKQWETRSWKTPYRGKLLICAARKVSGSQCEEYIRLGQKYGIDLDRRGWESLPKGGVIALCDLTDCVVMTPELIAQQSEKERDCGNWQPGRYAWKLENVVPLEPAIPVRGKQRLWEIDLETVGLNFSPTKKRGRKPGSKNSRPASGSLGPTVQHKSGKSYPAIEGERVSKDLAWDYPEQFVWLYNWSVQDSDGCWKNRSKRVPVGKIYSVSRAIALGKPVEEILRMI